MKLIMEQWRKIITESENDEKGGDYNVDLYLPKDKKVILKADTEDHDRGLVVEWLEGGGYDVYYWYKDPDVPVGAELKADGKSVGDDIKKVYLGFHEEIDK